MEIDKLLIKNQQEIEKLRKSLQTILRNVWRKDMTMQESCIIAEIKATLPEDLFNEVIESMS